MRLLTLTPKLGLLAALMIAGMTLFGCNRSTLAPSAVMFQSQPALPREDAPVAPATAKTESRTPQPRASAGPDLKVFEAIARNGGLINDLPAMARELAASSLQLQVIPRNSQDKADRLARDWASDAQQIYTIWAYWKLPALSITRHAYYSPSKGKAFKVEFTLASFFAKSFEEPADGLEQASMILNEARDRHAFGVKEAHAIARKIGYVPSKYGAAVLLDIKTYGPMWVFADMPSQTEGEPVMMVNAQTGMVTQGGEAMMLVQYLFQRAGY